MRMKSPSILVLPVLLAGLLLSSEAQAVKFLSLKKAVQSLLPEGAKIFKTTKDYGWTPQSDKVKIYLGKDAAGKTLAHIFVFRATASDWFHKFAVGVRPDGTVIALRVMELTCDWAYPVRRKAFLKQFENKRHTDPLTVKADIDGITRATVSSELAAQAVRKAVSLHQLLIVEGKAAKPSAKVSAARAKGQARIDLANSSGR